MKNKITPDIASVACDLYVRGATPPGICRALKLQGIVISRQSMHAWINNPVNSQQIEKARLNYINNTDDVNISHKKYRIQDLDIARDAIVKTLKTYITNEGTIYEKKIKAFTNLAKRLAEINIAARDEMEKKPEMLGRKIIGIFTDIPQEAIVNELAEIDRALGIKTGPGEKTDTLKAGTQSS